MASKQIVVLLRGPHIKKKFHMLLNLVLFAKVRMYEISTVRQSVTLQEINVLVICLVLNSQLLGELVQSRETDK